MGAATAAAHAGGPAHELGEQPARVAAVGQEVPVAAVVAEDQVLRPQVRQDAHCVGLLPKVGVGCAGENPLGEAG